MVSCNLALKIDPDEQLRPESAHFPVFPPKTGLTAVQGQLYGLNSSTVRLHDNLDDYPGLAELRLGPLLAKLIVDLVGIPHKHVNIKVFSVFACN